MQTECSAKAEINSGYIKPGGDRGMFSCPLCCGRPECLPLCEVLTLTDVFLPNPKHTVHWCFKCFTCLVINMISSRWLVFAGLRVPRGFSLPAPAKLIPGFSELQILPLVFYQLMCRLNKVCCMKQHAERRKVCTIRDACLRVKWVASINPVSSLYQAPTTSVGSGSSPGLNSVFKSIMCLMRNVEPIYTYEWRMEDI